MSKIRTIQDEIETICGSALCIPLQLRALTALFFKNKPDVKDTGRIMLAIEMLSTDLARRVAEPELGFEELWAEFDSNFSSVRSVAKGAMKVGYVAGKLNVTQ